jgi:rhodanese-related sulfurtransferase
MARALKNVDAHAAAKLQKSGALLVDVRESGEYAQVRIPGSQLASLSRFGMSELPLAPGQAVVFFCAGGNRTSANATRLAEKAGAADAYVMQGGISAWRQAGLPVESGSGSNEGTRPGFLSRVFGR